jgi:hypothetical protein
MKCFIGALGILVTVLANSVCGDGAVLAQDKSVKVYSLVRVSRKPPSILFPPPAEEASKEAFESYLRAQKLVIKSRFVLQVALQLPDARNLEVAKKDDPIAWLEKNLIVDSLDEPTVLRISLGGTQTPESVKIVNAVTRTYLDEIVNRERKATLERLDTLKGLNKSYEDRITNRQQQMRQLRGAAKDPRVWDSPEARKARRRALYTDQRDLKRELLRLHLAEEREKVLLEKAGGKQDAHKQELAVLEAQIGVVRQGLAKLGMELDLLEKQPELDLADLENDVRRWEPICRRLADEIDRLEIERLAPARVVLLQLAEIEPGR